MKLEDQVCSLKLSKRLKKLKIKQKSLWYWIYVENGPCLRLYCGEPLGITATYYSAFTVAELAEILPKAFKEDNLSLEINTENELFWDIYYRNVHTNICEITAMNEKLADAMAEALIEAIKYGYDPITKA